MYPFGTKSEKVLTYYRLLKWCKNEHKYEQINDKYGSDWIGFQSLNLDTLSAGHYLVEI